MMLWNLQFFPFDDQLAMKRNCPEDRVPMNGLFPNPLCVPKHKNECQKNRGKGNCELNWNGRSHQSIAQAGRATTAYEYLGDVTIIHHQSQMDYIIMTQPLEGLHSNAKILDGINSDRQSQEDHTQSFPSYKQVTNQDTSYNTFHTSYANTCCSLSFIDMNGQSYNSLVIA